MTRMQHSSLHHAPDTWEGGRGGRDAGGHDSLGGFARTFASQVGGLSLTVAHDEGLGRIGGNKVAAGWSTTAKAHAVGKWQFVCSARCSFSAVAEESAGRWGGGNLGVEVWRSSLVANGGLADVDRRRIDRILMASSTVGVLGPNAGSYLSWGITERRAAVCNRAGVDEAVDDCSRQVDEDEEGTVAGWE